MAVTDDEIVNAIIQREGDYVDHPADKGGPTRWGVTLETLTVFRGKACNADDVRHLSVNEARDIYKQKYIVNAKFGQLKDDRLKAFVIDSAVNHGIVMAVKLLQRAVGVPDDGILGPVTLEAIEEKGSIKTHLRMIGQRGIFYGRIVKKDPSQCVFIEGWMNRLNDCIEEFIG